MGLDYEKSASLDPDLSKGNGKSLTRSTKLLTTGSILFSNICLGAVLNCFGPAVADFENKYDSDVDRVSKIFTITTVGYLIGALLTGFVYNFLNRQFCVIIFITGMGIAVYLTPHCPSLTLLYCIAGLLGVSCGAYDCSQIVWMMEIWQHESGPFIQTQHAFYALGSLIPPLLLAPFLTKSTKESEDEILSTTTDKPMRNPDMYIPFTIIGALCTVAVLCHTYLFVFKRYFPPPPEVGRFDAKIKEEEEINNNNENEMESIKAKSKLEGFKELLSNINIRRLKLIILSAMFMGTYQGMEMCTMQFMPTFTSEGELDITESQGAYITSAFSGAFTLGRFLGIFAVLKIRPQFILLFTISTICCANVLLLLFANSSVTLLWVGAIMIGTGFSTTYPSFAVYIERHLLFTNAVGSTMLISGSGLASIYPLVIGKFVENNNRVLTFVNFFSLFWMVVAGSLIYKMTFRDAKKLDKK